MAAQPDLNGKAVTATVFLSMAVFVLVADLLTKWLAFQYLDPRWPHVAIPGFLNLVRAENQGAVFGIAQGKQTLFILFTLAAVPVIAWAAWKYGRSSLFLTFGLGCVLGGALGNLWDRCLIGHVRDFIDAHIGNLHWYTFNIADVAICVGAATLVLHSFRTPAAQETGDKK